MGDATNQQKILPPILIQLTYTRRKKDELEGQTQAFPLKPKLTYFEKKTGPRFHEKNANQIFVINIPG